MNDPAEIEIAGPNTGFEEEGIGGEVRVGPVLDHEIKGRDCFAEVARIEVADQTVVKGFEAEISQ